MLLIKSFLVRLKPKSALYFAVPFSIALAWIDRSPWTFLQSVSIFSIALYSASALALLWERRKKTGIQCRICGYGDCTLLYKARRRNSKQIGSFACSSFDHAQYPDIYFCPECKNGFLSSLAHSHSTSGVAEEAKTAYEEVVDHTYIENLPYRYDTYRRFTERYRDILEGKSVLEIGSYYGAFAESARKIAGSYTGVELSRHACAFLKAKHPDLNIIHGSVESLEGNPEFDKKFDVIAMFDVIEHVADPIKTLSSLRGFLKPGGKILFSTINIESSFSMLLGPWWPWFMDMHLYYFSDRGYHTMLHRSGYFMKNHHHFPYRVSLEYFLTKVGSMIGIKNLSRIFPQTDMTIPIKLGDTVLIIGENASL
jgi:2-polyprenyl-3-methyl-5-hydroxy-6-metoxy-1,4-benzoquinol methylase